MVATAAFKEGSLPAGITSLYTVQFEPIFDELYMHFSSCEVKIALNDIDGPTTFHNPLICHDHLTKYLLRWIVWENLGPGYIHVLQHLIPAVYSFFFTFFFFLFNNII